MDRLRGGSSGEVTFGQAATGSWRGGLRREMDHRDRGPAVGVGVAFEKHRRVVAWATSGRR